MGAVSVAAGSSLRTAAVYRTREDSAGWAPVEQTEPPSYRHILEGECRCGQTHAPAPIPVGVNGGRDRAPIVAVYDYHDEEGATLYQEIRRDPKGFSLRQPDASGTAAGSGTSRASGASSSACGR